MWFALVVVAILFLFALPRILPVVFCDWVLPRTPRDFASRYPRGWVLVTGASSGIGLAMCESLADAGFDLVMLARRPELLEHHARRLCTRGRKGSGNDSRPLRVRTASVDLSAVPRGSVSQPSVFHYASDARRHSVHIRSTDGVEAVGGARHTRGQSVSASASAPSTTSSTASSRGSPLKSSLSPADRWWLTDAPDGGVSERLLPRGESLSGAVLCAGVLPMEPFEARGGGCGGGNSLVDTVALGTTGLTSLVHACVTTIGRAGYQRVAPVGGVPLSSDRSPRGGPSSSSSSLATRAAMVVARGCTIALYLFLSLLGVGFVMEEPTAFSGPVSGGPGGFPASGGPGANPSAASRGFVVLVSSQTSWWPSPLSAVYSASKAYARWLAMGLWAEFGAAAAEGCAPPIDVLAVAPAYVWSTALFDNVPDLLFLRVLRWLGQSPQSVVAAVFNSTGRVPYRPTGLFTYISGAASWVLGDVAVAGVMKCICRWLPDYKKLRRQ